jgi:hypothetical protein
MLPKGPCPGPTGPLQQSRRNPQPGCMPQQNEGNAATQATAAGRHRTVSARLSVTLEVRRLCHTRSGLCCLQAHIIKVNRPKGDIMPYKQPCFVEFKNPMPPGYDGPLNSPYDDSPCARTP